MENFRTDREIYNQTNKLANIFYILKGYKGNEDKDYRISTHPEERLVWDMAKTAQEILTETPMDEVLSNLGEEV